MDPTIALFKRMYKSFGSDMRCNSLNHLPQEIIDYINISLGQMRDLGHDGHFDQNELWWKRARRYERELAGIVGFDYHAKNPPVALMNTLSVNNLFMLTDILNVLPDRKVNVIVPKNIFPSDLLTVVKAIHWRLRCGVQGAYKRIIFAEPSDGKYMYDEEKIAQQIKSNKKIGLGVFTTINYINGQRFNLRPISRALHQIGALLFVDSAHGFMNVEMESQTQGADVVTFAGYKYAGGTPGSIAGVAVHPQHLRGKGMFGDKYVVPGWFGVHPDQRFSGGSLPDVGSWRFAASNDPIANLLALEFLLMRVSEAGGHQVFIAENKRISTLFYQSLQEIPEVQFYTPEEWDKRGSQISFWVKGLDANHVERELHRLGSSCETRGHDVVRAASRFHTTEDQVFEFCEDLKTVIVRS